MGALRLPATLLLATTLLVTTQGCLDTAGRGVDGVPSPSWLPNPGATPARLSVVVGVSADAPLVSLTERLEARVEAPPGTVRADASWSRSAGDLSFPSEVAVEQLPDKSEIVATVQAFASDGTRLVTRIARTFADGERTMLLPVRLNDECIASADEPDVSCVEQTCSAGQCVNPLVKPDALSDYRPNWDSTPLHPCAGTAVTLELGMAGGEFVPLEAGDSVKAVAGNQGLAHLDLAVHMTGLDAASLTVLGGMAPEFDVTFQPRWEDASYNETASRCELQPLRLVLPNTWDSEIQLGATLIEANGNAEHHHVRVYVEGPDLER
jgi:hypothetical protein